jgi:chromate reductase
MVVAPRRSIDMHKIKVAVLVGSLRKESLNRRLARAVEKLAPDDFIFSHLTLGDLPLYDQDFDADYPAVCRQLKQDVQDADALLFACPEYNRSIPGVLKNALDIGSRPYGENAFAGKPAAMLGASPGATGTALAQQHLRNVLAYLDVPLLAQPEVYVQFKEGLIDGDGNVGNEGTRKFLQDFTDRYAGWVRKFVQESAGA